MGGELPAIKKQLREVAEGVLEGRTNTARGSVFATLYGVLIRAIEQERKIRENRRTGGQDLRVGASRTGAGEARRPQSVGLEDRVRRLEFTRASRFRSTGRQDELLRLAALTEHVREPGRDHVPDHLLTNDIEDEIATLEWLRSSGGWESAESRAFLAEWEERLAK